MKATAAPRGRMAQDSQCARILSRLESQWPDWCTMPELVEASGSFNIHTRIDELRHRYGVEIENQTDVTVRPHISRYRLSK